MARKPPASTSQTQQLELMRLLDEQPATSQREISSRLGLSLGKANYLIRALLDKGLVKIQNFQRSDNKMSYAYQLTPRGVSERVRLTRAFLARKEAEFELLKSEIQALQHQVEADNNASVRNKPRG
jgi:EPS-associated MarR family transcriptional regulator